LKIDADLFNAMRLDARRFITVTEFREYKIGDRILFEEIGCDGVPAGEFLKREIIYIMHGGAYGLPKCVAIIGLQKGA
jgi:hypothetical protein